VALPAADIWSTGLYEALRDHAAEEFPDSLERAFAQLCRYARIYTDTRRFRTWRTDFRRKQEAEDLLVLAQLDVAAFFRRHPPNDGGWDDVILGPPPLALTDGRVLEDA
jgi:hypothetical protein